MPLEPIAIEQLALNCLAGGWSPFALDAHVWAYRRQCGSGAVPVDVQAFVSDLINAMCNAREISAKRYGYSSPMGHEPQKARCFGPCQLPAHGCDSRMQDGETDGAPLVKHTSSGWALVTGEEFQSRLEAERAARSQLAVATFMSWLTEQPHSGRLATL